MTLAHTYLPHHLKHFIPNTADITMAATAAASSTAPTLHRSATIDVITGRPRTPNTQYTCLTEEQLGSIQQVCVFMFKFR